MKREKRLSGFLLTIVYGVGALLLFLYSYTQVDLSLTLSSANIWQTIQKWFQYIGYYNRPLSTSIYLGVLALFFLLYHISMWWAHKKKLTKKELWIIIGAITCIICLSYPAFSYDFFNYLFTAKTVLVYHKNPYLVTPLQFTGVESWLSFLHWTHLPSAYTPLWIGTTLLPYLFSFGYFLLMLWSLKIVVAAAYLLTALGIQKILEKVDKDRAVLGTAIFALNPLVIVECLVSGHNDILMMALVVWAIVLFQQGKRWASWFTLSLSIAMKLMTIFLIPVFFAKWNRKAALACMIVGFLAVLSQREVLGWYWVWIVPFVALLPELWAVTVISSGVSLGLLLRYAPFLYLGHWNDPAPLWKFWGTLVPIGASILIVVIGLLIKKGNLQNRLSR